MPRILYYLFAPIKALLLAFQLFYVSMFNVSAPEVYLVQVRRGECLQTAHFFLLADKTFASKIDRYRLSNHPRTKNEPCITLEPPRDPHAPCHADRQLA